MVHSSLARAVETADIASKCLQGSPRSARTCPEAPPGSLTPRLPGSRGLCGTMKPRPGSRLPPGIQPPARCPAAGGQVRDLHKPRQRLPYLCAGRCFPPQGWLRLSLSRAASPAWWSLLMAPWCSGPSGTRGSCLRTRSPAPGAALLTHGWPWRGSPKSTELRWATSFL